MSESSTPDPASVHRMLNILPKVSPDLVWNNSKGFVDGKGIVIHKLETKTSNARRKADGRLMGWLHRHAAYLLGLAARDSSCHHDLNAKTTPPSGGTEHHAGH